jgi:HSP20 family protein
MKRNSIARLPRTALLTDPFFRNLDRLFSDDVFAPFGSAGEGIERSGWTPAVDIRETEDAFVFTAELPGLEKSDVHITVENKVLTLSGERAWAEEDEKNSYRRIERAYGSFSRSFSLPNAVDASKVEANFKGGLLTIKVAKAEEVKPREIEIS